MPERKFNYVGAGTTFEGLPATDLFVSDLSADQLILLGMGVARGVYQEAPTFDASLEEAAPKATKKKKADLEPDPNHLAQD